MALRRAFSVLTPVVAPSRSAGLLNFTHCSHYKRLTVQEKAHRRQLQASVQPMFSYFPGMDLVREEVDDEVGPPAKASGSQRLLTLQETKAIARTRALNLAWRESFKLRSYLP